MPSHKDGVFWLLDFDLVMGRMPIVGTASGEVLTAGSGQPPSVIPPSPRTTSPQERL